MKHIKIVILAFLASFIFISCSSKSTSGSGDSGERGVYGDQYIGDEDLASELNRWDEHSSVPHAAADGLFEDIQFGYDSTFISSQDREKIRRNADVLKGDRSLRVEVEGHCDKRGTSEYNLALGEERARVVAEVLVGFGVTPTQISTISYGEELPVEAGDSEYSYSKNRRAHFALYRNPNSKR